MPTKRDFLARFPRIHHQDRDRRRRMSKELSVGGLEFWVNEVYGVTRKCDLGWFFGKQPAFTGVDHWRMG